MRRRRLVALAGLVALLGAVALLWPRPEAPERPSAHPYAASKAAQRRHSAPRPAAPPVEEQPQAEDERPMAVPFRADTGAPAEAPVVIHTILVLAVYPDDDPVRDDVVITSRDCGVWLRTEGGKPVPIRTEQERCTLKAGRRDGRLFAWSDPVEVEATDDGRVVSLVIPDEPTGGLGVAFGVEEGGMVVLHVWPGSPADRMGLSEGDLIVEVDGLPTETLTEDEFIAVMTGPVGSEVDFVVGSDADTGWAEESLVLTRERVE